MNALAKLVMNPRRYGPRILPVVLKKLSELLQGESFFLQSQMDIHPRAYSPSGLLPLTNGFYLRQSNVDRTICNLDPYDNTRRDMLVLLLRTVLEHTTGAFAELGVYQGLTARLIHHYAPERHLHLFDTFEGFPERNVTSELRDTGVTIRTDQFSDTSLDRVRAAIQPRNNHVSFHKGYFPDSIPTALHEETFAFVHLDADLYDPTFEGLRFFYPRMTRRGIIVVHDYNSWLGARKAVDVFFADKVEMPLPMPDKNGSAVIVKQ